MGCWNETCGVSKLPIRHGDPMVVILIRRSVGFKPNEIVGSRCYPTAFWQPMGFPIYGFYNDYGWIEKVEQSKFLDWTLAHVDSSLVPLEQGENKYHDIPVEKGKMSIEYLGELIHEGRLLVADPWSPPGTPVGAMMIRRDVFEQSLSEYRDREYVPDPGGDWRRGSYREYGWTEHLDKLKAASQTQEGDEKRLSRYGDERAEFEKMYADDRLRVALHPLHLYLNGIDYDEEIFEELARIKTFYAVLEQLRMHYGLSQGAGSQDQDYAAYQRHYKMCLDLVHQIMVRDREENES